MFRLSSRGLFVVFSILISIPACGFGGGGGGGDTAGGSAESQSLAQKTSFSDDDIKHFLKRTHFGYTKAEFDAVKAVGLPAYVQSMLVFPQVGTQQWEIDAAPLLTRQPSVNEPQGDLLGERPSNEQLVRWWLTMMVKTQKPFQELLAYFWHDRFALSCSQFPWEMNRYMKDYVNIFRGHGTGNFKSMVLEVARNGAMMQWLDGSLNQRQAPNENFSRELMELFTMGVNNGYTQPDVEQGAAALTGYKFTYSAQTNLYTLEFDANRHDVRTKFYLDAEIPGQNQTDDYEAVVNIIFSSRSQEVSRFIARKMIRFFCMDDPSDALVNALALHFKNNNWEISPVLKKLFLSKAFYSNESKSGLVRTPLEATVGFVRTAGNTITDVGQPWSGIYAYLYLQAHVPMNPPGVNGWPKGTQWLTSQLSVDYANFVTVFTTYGYSYDWQVRRDWIQGMLPPPGPLGEPPTSSQVVDAIAAKFDVTLNSDEKTSLIQYLNTKRLSDGTLVNEYFNPGDATHLLERGVGLIQILAVHPNYLVK